MVASPPSPSAAVAAALPPRPLISANTCTCSTYITNNVNCGYHNLFHPIKYTWYYVNVCMSSPAEVCQVLSLLACCLSPMSAHYCNLLYIV